VPGSRRLPHLGRPLDLHGPRDGGARRRVRGLRRLLERLLTIQSTEVEVRRCRASTLIFSAARNRSMRCSHHRSRSSPHPPARGRRKERWLSQCSGMSLDR
jgi:hypothetical protein